MISHLLLHLSLIQGVGHALTKAFLEKISTGGIDPYRFSAHDFVALGIKPELAQKIVDGLADQALLDAELALIEKHGIEWVTLADAAYPELLSHIHNAPPVVYWQGTPVWLTQKPTLAVVGARECSMYGKHAVEAVVAPCVQQGMVIISGGARGIDTVAHQVALQQGGQTVVVLGSGLLEPYPVSNKKLFLEVARNGGAVVSCFPLTAEAMPWQFPARNRVIAGLAQGCLVVQAAAESGALITSKYALYEGRNVYAIPGPFNDPLSEGCNRLLQEGAQLVLAANDILRDYNLLIPEKVVAISAKKIEKWESCGQKTITFKEKVVVDKNSLEALCEAPIGLDELVIQTGKTENELNQELFELQLAGKLQQDFAGLWSRI